MSSIDFASHEGLDEYLQGASIEELREIAEKLKVDIDTLPGEDSKSKAKELIAYVDRRHQLPDLVLEAMRLYATRRLQSDDIGSLGSDEITLPVAEGSSLSALNYQIKSLHQQVEELRQQPSQTGDTAKLDELARTADTASRLTADIVLPSADAMAVRLVPVHQLERLEEYRSDENWGFLLIGTFLGGVLGILVNAANTDNFAFSRPSIVLMGVMFVLTVLSLLWTIRLKKRAIEITKGMIPGKKSKVG